MICVSDAMNSYIIDTLTCHHTKRYWSDVQDLYRFGTMDYDILASAIKLFKYFHSMYTDGWSVELHLPTGCASKPLWPFYVADNQPTCACDRVPEGVIMSPEAMGTYLLLRILPGQDDDDGALIHAMLVHYRRVILCVYSGGTIALRRSEDVKLVAANVFPHLMVKTSVAM